MGARKGRGALPPVGALGALTNVHSTIIPVTTRATGTFDVTVVPQPADDYSESGTLGRMTIDKVLHGDLRGTSKGQMLTAMTSIPASAGYVAVERVTGTLHGTPGTFALMHTGTMTRGVPGLVISVVPDSGTGALTGLVGSFNIIRANGQHAYEFDYELIPLA